MFYTFDANNIKKTLYINSYEELLEFISDEDILQYVYGDFKIDKHMPCPFKKETIPSFYVSYYKGQLVWRRFGLYDEPHNMLDLVMKLQNLNFSQALNWCYKEIYLKGNYNKDKNHNSKYKEKTKKYDYIVQRNWDKYDIEYWKQYNLSYKEIENNWNVVPIKEWWSGNTPEFKIKRLSSTPDKPLYYYNHGKNYNEEDIWTIYNPNGKKYDEPRFIKKNVTNHIMGMDKLSILNDIVIITSSYKDIMVWDKLGYKAVAPHTESGKISKDILTILNNTCDVLLINYDSDELGEWSSNKLIEQNPDIPLIPLVIENSAEPLIKDISDFISYELYQNKDFSDIQFNLKEYVTHIINNYQSDEKNR